MERGTVKPAMWAALRTATASAISEAKAYDVPSLCARLGLADGTEEEAFRSKFTYAKARLSGVAPQRVLDVARNLLVEMENFDLSEIVAKIEETGTPEVTQLTRRRLMSVFDGTALCTELPEIDLIRKVWPTSRMRAAFQSEGTLDDELWQHTVRNDDWDRRTLFEALDLLTCSRAQLFRLLTALSDPEMQNPESQKSIVEALNAHLRHDGYGLEFAGLISGSPRYEVRELAQGSPADSGISAALASFDPTTIHARWTEALEQRTNQPERAITLARTLLEDVCKWIIDQAGETYREKDDLPVLYRQLSKILNLAPDGHTEEVFRTILGSCQAIVESIGAIRNKLSDAHSIGPKRARPLPRHAELAVNLSGAMATFLIQTWQARQTVASFPTKMDRSAGARLV
jgi:hypothetical protein